jgi:hypothetical protein
VEFRTVVLLLVVDVTGFVVLAIEVVLFAFSFVGAFLTGVVVVAAGVFLAAGVALVTGVFAAVAAGFLAAAVPCCFAPSAAFAMPPTLATHLLDFNCCIVRGHLHCSADCCCLRSSTTDILSFGCE